MTVLRVHEIQQAVGAIMATRLHTHQEDLFIYMDDQLLYAFYHEQDTEVITACSGNEHILHALYHPSGS